MRITFIAFLCLAVFSVEAQTKKIAFKSHSGNMANFNTALENDLFETDHSNFGHAPQRNVVTAQLDSLIFVSDTMAILVTSEYCTRTDRISDKPVTDPKLWKAGREVALNHPLFSRQHSLDSIKKVIAEKYNFQNPVEKVIFVGYDNKKPVKKKDKKKKEQPLVVSASKEQEPASENGQLAFLFGGVILASMLAGKASQRNS